jgi:hypothetical protein
LMLSPPSSLLTLYTGYAIPVNKNKISVSEKKVTAYEMKILALTTKLGITICNCRIW